MCEIRRVEIRALFDTVARLLNSMWTGQLTQFLGRQLYERTEKPSNHRNGSYGRAYTLKGIGKVHVKVPRDRQSQFQTQVIPRSKPYEDELRKDLSLMFLTGISTRTLSIMSTRLNGRIH